MSEACSLSELPHPLRAALERRGFTTLTKVQQQVVATDLTGRDLRISSQTGSGKTVAVGLAVAEFLLEGSAVGPAPRVLVLTPTRELAAQVRAELAALYADVEGLSVMLVTGGTDPARERRALAKGPAVLVATPGRLLDHVRSGAASLEGVQHAVLDEADQMLDLGFRDELDAIVEQLPATRQLHMVSATFARDVLSFADRFQRNVLHVEGTRLGAANEDIEHIAHLVFSEQRHAALINILLADQDNGLWLVFVRRRADTVQLAERLVEDGFSAMAFSGELSQPQRDRTLAAFRKGLARVLVATDVAARGIDIQDISTVVNFDLPGDRDTFTHRAGRTGRAGQKGRSILLVPPNAERRTRELLKRTGVTADWQAVPDARRIDKALVKRTRRALHTRLGASQESAIKHLDYARGLLDKHDPATLIAVLLEMAKADLPREPVDVRFLEPTGDQPLQERSRARRRRFGHSRPRRHPSLQRRGIGR